MGNSASSNTRRHGILPAHRYPLYRKMTWRDKLLFRIVHWVDRCCSFWNLPVFLGLVYLEIRRGLHQRYNLLDVPDEGCSNQDFNHAIHPKDKLLAMLNIQESRTSDGEHTDLSNPEAGESYSFFGRNMPPQYQTSEVLDPHPTTVASKLLARKQFVDTGLQFNMLAAAWIQFMIHDWVDHLEDTKQVEIVAPKSLLSSCPLASYKFFASEEFQAGSNSNDIQFGYRNRRTPWWDGSVIYGSNSTTLHRVRTFKDGKLKLAEDSLLEYDKEGLPISGDVRNTWAGITILQSLFIKEHNAICDMLKKHHPEFDDQQLYTHARLATSATIAKIHTIDWTVELLKMDTLYVGMRANWYGLLGKKFKDTFGHTGIQLLSGYVGMPKPENHKVPYSLTEDFVSVYRMHSLLPDSIIVRNITQLQEGNKEKTPPVLKEITMPQLIGSQSRDGLASIGNERMIVSMGHQACGALTLWNYPIWLRSLVPQDIDGQDRNDKVDLPSLEIYRDRERSVPRYNEFRRRLLLIPISTWEDLTNDTSIIETLQDIYGNDVEKLDLLVGMMAEKKPTGYAISETAFIIFLLMASRRLEADRFFTSDFNEKVYTKEGLAWVNNTEGLKDVLIRHHPQIVQNWLNPGISAFSVWKAKPKPFNPIPIYFRIP